MQIAFPEMQIPFLRNANGMLDIYDTPFARTVRCVHRIANAILIMRLTCPVVRACSYGGALDFIVYTISQKWILHFQKCILHFWEMVFAFLEMQNAFLRNARAFSEMQRWYAEYLCCTVRWDRSLCSSHSKLNTYHEAHLSDRQSMSPWWGTGFYSFSDFSSFLEHFWKWGLGWIRKKYEINIFVWWRRDKSIRMNLLPHILAS